MKYFVVVTLMICVLGVSSVFAVQAKTVTSNQATVCQTVVQGNPLIDFFMHLPINTVKYAMPIEVLLGAIPGFGLFFTLAWLTQLYILFLPILVVFSIFGVML